MNNKVRVVLVVLAMVAIFGSGMTVSYQLTKKLLSPSIVDFDIAQKFHEIVNQEIDNEATLNKKKGGSYFIAHSWNLRPSLRGPVVVIEGNSDSWRQYRITIVIRNELQNKVYSLSNGSCVYDENWEKVRPLAKQIAKQIVYQ